MEVRILKNTSGLNGTIFNGQVLEKSERDSEFSGIRRIHYYLHNIDDNQSEEILPQIEKYDIGEIKNCSLATQYLYFTNIFEKNNTGIVSIIRYDLVNKTTQSIYSYEDNIFEYPKTKRLRIFIINDLYVFLQKEYLTFNAGRTYAGFFKCKSRLLNLKDGGEYDLTEDKFIRYGIADMLQISESQLVIKTGFSLLVDNRYNELEEEEACLEGISILNIGQMISDLMLSGDNIVLDTIEQAFYSKTIPYIKKAGGYLIYTVVDNENKQEEVKFYHIETSEVKSCIHQDVIRTPDLAIPYVIQDEPYICVTKDNAISFLNLSSGKVDVKFDMTTTAGTFKLENVFHSSVLFSGNTKRTLLKKSKSFIDLYSFPGKELLLHENLQYADSIATKEDNIYIFTN